MLNERQHEWKYRPLLECVRTIGGGTPSRKLPEYFQGEIPWLTVTDMPADVGILNTVTSARQAITSEALQNSAAKLVPKGAVLFTTRVAVAKVAIAGAGLTTNQDLISFVPSPELDARFLGYYLLSLRNYLEITVARGATIKGLPKSVLGRVQLPIPPLHEQHRIVKRIEGLLHRIGEADALRREAFTETDTIYLSTLQEIGEEVVTYATRPLGSIAQIAYGLTKDPRRSGGGNPIPYLRVANVQAGYLDLTQMKKLHVSPEESARYLLRPEDVLFVEGNSEELVGRCAVWRGELPICAHQNHVIRARVNPSEALADYILLLSRSPVGQSYFRSVVKRTTGIASVNSSQIRNFPIPLPPVADQHRIVEHANSVREKTEELKTLQIQAQEELRSIVPSILAKAFEGRL